MVDGSGRRFLSADASPSAQLSQLPAWVRLVRAPNPGPMTLDGTNTWVLRAAGGLASIVVDPGPLHDGHLSAVAAAAEARAVTVITTHGHLDHTEGLDRFLQLCPTARAWDPRTGAGELADGSGVEVTVLQTPGHTADSITLLVRAGAQRAVITGDTVLGRGTTVVAYPDGDLGAYLQSLRRLEQLGQVPVLPGHGPALVDCAAAAGYYLEHRLARLDQVRAARAAGAATVADVVTQVYGDIDPRLRRAAEWSVRAQLAYLAAGQEQPANVVAEPDQPRESTDEQPGLDPP
jgi:glyoxylase-like metal-dependent hydrolase (beta-lactamase superfamily II)